MSEDVHDISDGPLPLRDRLLTPNQQSVNDKLAAILVEVISLRKLVEARL